MSGSGSIWLQSVLEPYGAHAARIEFLWWLFFWTCTAVFVAVVAVLLLALFRRRRRIVTDPRDGEPRKIHVVGAATALTVTVLVAFIVASVVVSRPVPVRAALDREPVMIDVVGHQWWWEIVYDDPIASRRFRTANELRVPVGRPVIVRLTSRDVIHSFWVPSLHGKMDLIPGRTTTTWFEADETGTFRGQCAEFCGIQHAKMAFTVIAESPERYAAWAEEQRRPAAEPAAGEARRGRDVFLAQQCSLCHTIRGTGAWGTVAPDLTRVGSRLTLAAGTLPNTRGHLAGWLVDPQRIKPGSFMPPTQLAPTDLSALVAYLESLR